MRLPVTTISLSWFSAVSGAAGAGLSAARAAGPQANPKVMIAATAGRSRVADDRDEPGATIFDIRFSPSMLVAILAHSEVVGNINYIEHDRAEHLADR